MRGASPSRSPRVFLPIQRGDAVALSPARRCRGAARATALYTTVIFATVAVIMLTVAAGSVAGPTAFWPVFPLTAAAIASFVAWIKA